MQTEREHTTTATLGNPTALTYRHGTQLWLTPAGKARMAKRMTELCECHTPANDLAEILNQEFGLKRTIQDYWQLAHRLGLSWTPVKRRPPEVPLAELPMCKYCGKVRMPVLYNLSNTYGERLLLCENRCCPTCGGKLELHTTVDKATGKPEIRYWAHALPLLPRNCANPKCGKEFTPEDIKKAHQECCSKPCIRIFAVRNWEKNHPEEARKLAKKSAERRRHFTNLGRQFASGQIQPQRGGNGKGQAVAGTKQKKNTGPKTGKKDRPRT
jgi:hypothetical protein